MDEQALVTIDIKTIKTEQLMPNDVESLFIPMDEFHLVTGQDTVFIIGPKGSGKSMVLRYLSFPVQLERFKNKSQIQFDDSNIGVYIRCNEHFFGNEKTHMETNTRSIEYSKSRFIHMFNVTVCIQLLSFVSMNDTIFSLTIAEENETCRSISRLTGIEVQNTFINLIDKLRDQQITIFRDRSKNSIPESYFTTFNFLLNIQEILQQNAKGFYNKNIVILLDEYQELSSIQQKLISEILAIRKPIFKIASLPIGLDITREKTGKTLDLHQDFQIVNYHVHNIISDTEQINQLKDYFIKMSNKRLKPFNLNLETLLTNHVSEESVNKNGKITFHGIQDYALLSSGNSKDFLDLLNLTLLKWNKTGNKIPIAVQNEAIKQFSRKQMENIDYIPGISPQHLTSVIQKLGTLFSNYLRETGRYYLQVGIKDPENFSLETRKILDVGLKFSYLMRPMSERYSRDGKKMYSITLKNSLLPFFGIPIKSHQIRELSARDFDKLIDLRSTIEGTNIKLDAQVEEPDIYQKSIDVYSGVIDTIVDHIRKQQCILFVGSGFSANAGYPTGKELAMEIANYFTIPRSSEDISIVADKIIASGKTKGDIIRVIKDKFDEVNEVIPDYFTKLLDLNIKTIFTTNWDDILEKILSQKQIAHHVITRDESLSLVSSNQKLIYKLHGDFKNPDKFVITENDVLNIVNNQPKIMQELAHYFIHNHVVFIGYGMNDFDFKTIYNLINNEENKLAFSCYATARNINESDTNLLRSKGITLLKLTVQEFIEGICDRIFKAEGK